MLTVVLVDDAADLRFLLRARLRFDGRFDIVGEGGSGFDAIKLAEEHRPDLLLLDVSMPEMDGLEALPDVVAGSPATRVVMFSGFEGQGLTDHALALGATAFITKSLPIEELPGRLFEIAGGEHASAPPPDRRTPPADDVLVQQLERFRAVFDEAAIGMATLTLRGRIVRANAALETITDATERGLVGSTFAELVHADDRPAALAVVAEVARGAVEERRLEHRVAGGHNLRMTSRLRAITDASGQPLYLFLQVVDVSERRAAEEDLRQSEERFRVLVDGVRDYAIFMLDPGGRVATWNQGAQRIKGWTRDEIVGRHFRAFYTEDAQADRHPEAELEIAVAEGRYEEEGWRVRKDGTQFWANVVITALRDDSGALTGFAKVTRDITDRRRMEQELHTAVNERIEFLASTAHELRNPTAVMRGFASTLEHNWDKLDDEERLEMLRAIARGGERLGRLVDNLLLAARLERDVIDIHLATVPLAQALTDAVNHRRDQSVQPIVVACDPGLAVIADPVRLDQMLANYIDNATAHGAAPIQVDASALGDAVVVVVSDSGPGVPPEIGGRLFNRFGKGDQGTGSGLGLFLVRELARAQHGDAWLDATSDRGARFALRLPAASRPDGQTA